MSNVIKVLKENRKTILLIMFAPAMTYIFNVLVKAIFNSGTYLGSFIRGVFSLV